MIEKLITVLFSLGVVTIYILVGLAIAILTQFIVYQLTGFSIYNFIVRKLIIEQINN